VRRAKNSSGRSEIIQLRSCVVLIRDEDRGEKPLASSRPRSLPSGPNLEQEDRKRPRGRALLPCHPPKKKPPDVTRAAKALWEFQMKKQISCYAGTMSGLRRLRRQLISNSVASLH